MAISTAVWKYPIPLEDWPELPMPLGADVLCVQMQGDMPCLWARVDPDAAKTIRQFRWAGTGHQLTPDVGRYVGSVQMMGGALVFHLFEVTP